MEKLVEYKKFIGNGKTPDALLKELKDMNPYEVEASGFPYLIKSEIETLEKKIEIINEINHSGKVVRNENICYNGHYHGPSPEKPLEFPLETIKLRINIDTKKIFRGTEHLNEMDQGYVFRCSLYQMFTKFIIQNRRKNFTLNTFENFVSDECGDYAPDFFYIDQTSGKMYAISRIDQENDAAFVCFCFTCEKKTSFVGCGDKIFHKLDTTYYKFSKTGGEFFDAFYFICGCSR